MNNENPVAEIARAAAVAGAAVLPASAPLTVGAVAEGDPQVAGPFSGAVLAEVEGPVPGRIAVLVGKELVEALASSPVGKLDLAAALQPTLDAVAESLHTRVGAARMVGIGLVVRDVGSPFTVAFLHTASVAGAIIVPDSLLVSAQNAEISEGSAQAPEPEIVELAPAVAENAGSVLSSVGTHAGTHDGARDGARDHHAGIELLHGVDMEVTVEIGRTRMTVRDLLELAPGAVLELDRAAGSPADLLVNGRLIARGEVVVIDEDFGLRITEIAVDAAAS
jgi:flagellar motor switch protein FliN/FliY